MYLSIRDRIVGILVLEVLPHKPQTIYMLIIKFFSRSILAIIGILIVFQHTSCFKSGGTTFYDCPAFADPLYDEWFPYLKGQIIRYKNAAGFENTITIEMMEKTPTYKYYDGGGSCAPSVSVRTSLPTFSSIPFQIQYGKGTSFNNLYIGLKNIVINAGNIRDTGIVIQASSINRFNKSQFFPTYTLNGINYSNVQVISRDTISDKATDIYKVFIAKKIGILGYEEYPSLVLFSKQ